MIWMGGSGLSGQEAPLIRNFTPEDYQAGNQNWALADGAEGWIYTANNGGLLEFDGTQWRQYPLPERQTLRTVAVAGSDSLIFCGGFAEFGYWRPDPAGRLSYTSLSDQVSEGQLAREEIWHIVVGDGFVLFQSFSTLYKYDYRQVRVLRPPNAIMFAQVVSGRVLVPVIDRGLYELLPDDTFRFVRGSEPLAREIVQFLVPNGRGGIWAGTTNNGIFELEGHRCVPWADPLNTALARYQLNRAVALRDGGWAIGTILNGVYILDAAGRLRYHMNRAKGLQNNTVLALLEDRFGNLWMGLDKGLDWVNLQNPLQFFIDRSGRIGTAYTAAVWDGQLLVGTNQGLFTRALCTQAGPCDQEFRLLEGTQGQVWQVKAFNGQLLCGHNSGTFEVHGKRVQRISAITGGWTTVEIPGKPGFLLQSTYTGLIIFRQVSGNWTFSHRVGGFSEPLRKIVFDGNGNIWAVHPNQGLYRIRMSEDLRQVREYQFFTRRNGIPADLQLDLALINGVVVVNTNAGPLQVRERAGAILFEPLPGSQPGERWLSGLRDHVFIVDSMGVRICIEDRQAKLPLELVPHYENIVALDSATYLFCTAEGFATLDWRRLHIEPGESALPPVLIRGVISGKGNLGVEKKGQWIFPFSDNTLVFRFATPSYDRPPRFSWRLDGFTPDWSEWQTPSEKEFTNLPSGDYIFRVREANSMEEASIAIRIEPPWYRHPAMLVAYGLLFLGFGLGLEKMYQRRLSRQRRHLEEEKRKELEGQRVAADREKLTLEVDNKSRELSNAALNLIRKNEILQHVREKLQAARHDDSRTVGQLVRLIDQHLESDHDWEVFEATFSKVHNDFFRRMLDHYPDLTPGDMRLAAFLKMNLSSKEIAPLLNISVRGVENKRYRLRKKLGLAEDANLTEFMMGF